MILSFVVRCFFQIQKLEFDNFPEKN